MFTVSEQLLGTKQTVPVYIVDPTDTEAAGLVCLQFWGTDYLELSILKFGCNFLLSPSEGDVIIYIERHRISSFFGVLQKIISDCTYFDAYQGMCTNLIKKMARKL